LASNEQADSKPSPSVKLKTSPGECLQSIGPASHATETCANLPQSDLLPMELPLTLLQADSRAKTLALQEKVWGWPANEVDYSLKSPVLLANYDLQSSSWKTSERCFVEEWMPFLGRWPRSGMMRNGTAYQLHTLACLTLATGCGLLPTLGKNEPKGAGKKRFRGSTEFRGAKMSEGLRNGPEDPIYLHPDFAEEVMGFPIGWTELQPSETP